MYLGGIAGQLYKCSNCGYIGPIVLVCACIAYKDGKTFIIHLGSPYYKWLVTLVSKKLGKRVVIENSYEYYRRTIQAILEMITKKKAPINPMDTLEVIRICYAVQKSIKEGGREIILDKEFPIPDDLKSLE